VSASLGGFYEIAFIFLANQKTWGSSQRKGGGDWRARAPSAPQGREPYETDMCRTIVPMVQIQRCTST
jgi:hypothetical protein